MALSVQNKNFLSVLNRLEIDIKQFPDQTFDGLFDNIPKGMTYFFNWLSDNITTENVLTDLEESVFFELKKNKSLFLVDETEYFLSVNKPNFEDLQFLDSHYVNFFLTEGLKELKMHHKHLKETTEIIQLAGQEIKKNQNNMKEQISYRKRQINEIKENTKKKNSLFTDRLLKTKFFIETKSFYPLNLEIYMNLLEEEKVVHELLKTNFFVENSNYDSTYLEFLPKLEKDLINIEMILILCLSCLSERKAKIQTLNNAISKKKNFPNLEDSVLWDSSNFLNSSNSFDEDNLIMENSLSENVQERSQLQIQKVSNKYFEKTTDLKISHLEELIDCKKYIKSYCVFYSLISHIVFDSITSLIKIQEKKKQQVVILHENEKNFDNWIRNFELRKEVLKKNSSKKIPCQVISATNCESNAKVKEEIFSKSLLHLMENSNFITHKFRRNMQLLIKSLFNNNLCGPTNQILLTEVHLFIKYQNCAQKEKKVSDLIKCLVNKYLETKESVLKSNRKKLMLWADFLTNHNVLEEDVK